MRILKIWVTETIGNYVKYLQEACILTKAKRYDVKGKRILETNEKYYLTDHSLQYAGREDPGRNIQNILENIVFMELIRRGYKVFVGKVDVGQISKEVDFIAEKDNKKVYIQVCYEFAGSKETIDREFSSLKEIKDSYPKYVVTMDRYWNINDEGVQGIHLKVFLLLEKF
jgi:predicted AAA+ superfamily ATPase